MKRVSGDAVWKALSEDPLFLAEIPEELWPALKPYIEALPEILADLLDEPVTLMTLLKAKAAFVRYCLESDYACEMAAAIPEDQLFFVGISNEEVIARMDALTRGALQFLETIVEDVPGFLQVFDVTEEQAILAFKPVLSPENLKKYRAGKLTIGDILLSQPMLIIKNID